MIAANKDATDTNADQSARSVPEVDLHGHDAIRRIAAERHRKADTDGRRRRERQTVADNHLT